MNVPINDILKEKKVLTIKELEMIGFMIVKMTLEELIKVHIDRKI